jgi:hypothetical protein
VSETMVGSVGLTVSPLARRVGLGADTVRYYERAEFFRSARTVRRSRGRYGLVCDKHRSHRLGFRPMSSRQRSTSRFSTPGRTVRLIAGVFAGLVPRPVV